MACSPDGAPGSFADWSSEPDAAYDGLSVPMVVPWNGDRRLYIGWLRHSEGAGTRPSVIAGWGGWLVFRELVTHPDGHLGMKWVPEIEPPTAPRTFHVAPGRGFKCRFSRVGGRGDAPPLVLAVDPAMREAWFADDTPEAVFGKRCEAQNVKIGGLRGIDGAYDVRVVVHYDPKADATIFDAEIGGERTLICRRAGRYEMVESCREIAAEMYPRRAAGGGKAAPRRPRPPDHDDQRLLRLLDAGFATQVLPA